MLVWFTTSPLFKKLEGGKNTGKLTCTIIINTCKLTAFCKTYQLYR